jgi:hypothetical protein
VTLRAITRRRFICFYNVLSGAVLGFSSESVEHDNQTRARSRPGDGRVPGRRRLRAHAPFIQHVLEVFGVEAGTEEIKASVKQVEETLKRTYQDLNETLS